MTDSSHAGVSDAGDAPVSAQALAGLNAARDALLEVHRALLNAERQRYEKIHERIPNNGAFLQLVIADPWFAWLRPMAQLVLMIDERTSDKKVPLLTTEALSLLDRAKAMLQADEEGDAFQRLFFQAMQSSPELTDLFRRLKARKGG